MREPNQTTRLAIPTSPTCHQEPQPPDSQVAVKLLISIRDTEEAAIVRQAGVDWIDLKEPRAGSLGRPSLSEAVAVAELLHDHPQRSAALGELCELDEQAAFDFAPLFPVLKVGLSHVADVPYSTKSWQTRFESLATQLRERGAELIPVAYADWSICGAPSLQDVLEVARQVHSGHLLIDTFIKDGRSLLDWLSLDGLNQVIQSAREFHCGIVLAGSLKIDDVSKLLKLQPAALAVRGAVCQSEPSNTQPHATQIIQARTTAIDPCKVELWRRIIPRVSP